MPLWLAALIRFVSDFMARVVKDARRDAELKQAGRAEQSAADNRAAADAERKASAVPNQSLDDTISDLNKGEF